MARRLLFALAGLGALVSIPGVALAQGVVVTFSGAEDFAGDIACRLFSGPKNFPNGSATAGQQRLARKKGGGACRFSNLAPGKYALVAAVLPPGLNDVTTDMFGRPNQPWGVSNNRRPTFRAPQFEEAAFEVLAGQVTRLRITLAR
jgi:uncharacterized protein (DUF2141 family)